jgi:hypothetical protein
MRLLGRDMNHDSEIDIYLGLDVGKGEHHGIALTPAGPRRRAAARALAPSGARVLGVSPQQGGPRRRHRTG